MSKYFHFTIGPVQGFVAQARRTRDFWAGSFILSYLSAVAMKAVQVQKGKILFPTADPVFLACLTEPEKQPEKPTQGSVPNRFKAEVGDEFNPDQVVASVLRAWSGLADLVWNEDLSKIDPSLLSKETISIWNRQIENFWEIAWTLTPDLGESNSLDRRKSLRHQLPPAEPGIKCVIMDGWQELSGAPRPGDPHLTKFWQEVQRRIRGHDLREGEHLCALAFLKRRFAHCFHRLNVSMPNGWTLRGWNVPTAVPSVAYLAAAPWLAEAVLRLDAEALKRFEQPARKLSRGYGEWHTDLRCLLDAEKEAGQSAHLFRSLDGALFFEANLDNERLYTNREQATEVKNALAALRSEANLGPPSPFYAVLMMDGDSLGQQLQDVEKQPGISRALGEFTQAVQNIVLRHSGFLVYAGGDDVLALLPLETTLGCALELRQKYLECFEKTTCTSTLSGAVVFAHFKVPLTRVLMDAHHLLDDVAKDQRGRDALAIRAQTIGSWVLQWSMPWLEALEKTPPPDSLEDSTGHGQRLVLEALAEEFAAAVEKRTEVGNTDTGNGDTVDDAFSSGFFYRLRELFQLMNPRRNEPDDPGLSSEEAVELMTAEYLASGFRQQEVGEEIPAPQATQRIEAARGTVRRLLEQCRPVTRRFDEGKGVKRIASRRLEPDGGLLVRFLARKGIEQ